MPVRRAEAVWNGTLREGSGTMKFGGGAFEGQYSFSSRFEEGPGTNPEELIAAAEASCYAMALSSNLTRQNTPPEIINAKATLTMRRDEGGTKLTRLHLDVEARVPGLDEAAFLALAEKVKESCPVSVLLKPGLEQLTVSARLLK